MVMQVQKTNRSTNAKRGFLKNHQSFPNFSLSRETWNRLSLIRRSRRCLSLYGNPPGPRNRRCCCTNSPREVGRHGVESWNLAWCNYFIALSSARRTRTRWIIEPEKSETIGEPVCAVICQLIAPFFPRQKVRVARHGRDNGLGPSLKWAVFRWLRSCIFPTFSTSVKAFTCILKLNYRLLKTYESNAKNNKLL